MIKGIIKNPISKSRAGDSIVHAANTSLVLAGRNLRNLAIMEIRKGRGDFSPLPNNLHFPKGG
jgi:hypothetical protein